MNGLVSYYFRRNRCTNQTYILQMKQIENDSDIFPPPIQFEFRHETYVFVKVYNNFTKT